MKSLHGLAKENNVEEMIKLLTSRENVNARDKLKRWVWPKAFIQEPLFIWHATLGVWKRRGCSSSMEPM